MKWFPLLSHRTYIYRSVVALLIGLAVLFIPNDALNTIVILMGVFILFAGLGTAIVAYRSSQNFFVGLGGTSSIVSIIVGMLFILNPSFFINMILVILGLILFILGVFQLTNVYQMRKELRNASFYYIGGVIPLVVGLLFLFFRDTVITSLGIVIGLTLIVYALNELGLGFRMKKNIKNKEKIEDVAFEEIS